MVLADPPTRTAAGLLESERAAFEESRQQLVATAEGQFALVHGREVLGVFHSRLDAIAQGFRLLGNTPFLVKRIEWADTPESVISGLLAV